MIPTALFIDVDSLAREALREVHVSIIGLGAGSHPEAQKRLLVTSQVESVFFNFPASIFCDFSLSFWNSCLVRESFT